MKRPGSHQNNSTLTMRSFTHHQLSVESHRLFSNTLSEAALPARDRLLVDCPFPNKYAQSEAPFFLSHAEWRWLNAMAQPPFARRAALSDLFRYVNGQ